MSERLQQTSSSSLTWGRLPCRQTKPSHPRHWPPLGHPGGDAATGHGPAECQVHQHGLWRATPAHSPVRSAASTCCAAGCCTYMSGAGLYVCEHVVLSITLCWNAFDQKRETLDRSGQSQWGVCLPSFLHLSCPLPMLLRCAALCVPTLC